MKPAIRVENLSKQYRIGTRTRSASRNLTESIVDGASALCRRLAGRAQGGDGASEFWALKDVSFEVQPGEVMGIIGRNGAGKSTLLKILSRITEPTSGRAVARGRMGSLLEVGTGFNPELTGRENIYLNGSILGMSAKEIDRKLEEIVAFAEVERFLDMPVKRYSSGMSVRLAFAVAAHLQPEILIIDEVLAVGDAAFQKRCLGKMRDVRNSGRTVLFVSHNMPVMENLCDRCVFLSDGKVQRVGTPAEIVTDYLQTTRAISADAEEDLTSHRNRAKESRPVMTRVKLRAPGGRGGNVICMGFPLSIHVSFDSDEALNPVLGVVVRDKNEMAVFGINNRIIPSSQLAYRVRSGAIACHFAQLPLMPGFYGLDLFFGDEHRDIDVVSQAITFHVEAADVFGSGRIPPESAGPVYVPASWSFDVAVGERSVCPETCA